MIEVENRFIELLKQNGFPGGIYYPDDTDLNESSFFWLNINIKNLFDSNFLNLNNKSPFFFFINDYRINACCKKENDYYFLGFTKGLIHYSYFFFNNILKDDFFLNDVLVEKAADKVIEIKEPQSDS